MTGQRVFLRRTAADSSPRSLPHEKEQELCRKLPSLTVGRKGRIQAYTFLSFICIIRGQKGRVVDAHSYRHIPCVQELSLPVERFDEIRIEDRSEVIEPVLSDIPLDDILAGYHEIKRSAHDEGQKLLLVLVAVLDQLRFFRVGSDICVAVDRNVIFFRLERLLFKGLLNILLSRVFGHKIDHLDTEGFRVPENRGPQKQDHND